LLLWTVLGDLLVVGPNDYLQTGSLLYMHGMLLVEHIDPGIQIICTNCTSRINSQFNKCTVCDVEIDVSKCREYVDPIALLQSKPSAGEAIGEMVADSTDLVATQAEELADVETNKANVTSDVGSVPLDSNHEGRQGNEEVLPAITRKGNACKNCTAMLKKTGKRCHTHSQSHAD
jgi:hypothetical protein